MKNYSIAFLLISLISACRITQPIPSSVAIVPLNNYFIKNTPALLEDVNYMAFTSPTAFYNMFGIAKTMENEVRQPNFDGQIVVAIAMKPTNRNVTIRFSKAEINGRHLNAFYTVTESNTPLSYTQTPLAVATVPKGLDVKEIQFYLKENKVAIVAL
jgi:hypothetical protein